ncbi:sulfotransferase [candidate division CSSED10-310 bacterium]|uniref:Sulfotransferase n=1 Tax=candidate division CSSED10-310 bacterium TaxID=2855610 RepID=A0ABV6Z2J3_UNCC1
MVNNFWNALLPRISPSFLIGITLGDFGNLLRQNRFAVEPRQAMRVLVISCFALINTLIRRREEKLFGSSVSQMEVRAPLFILGAGRCGTTFLHNLLSIDQRYAFPNYYQVRNPHTFLLTERFVTRISASLLPKKRVQDNVNITWQSPDEDEFAISLMTLHSPLLSLLFPHQRQFYDQYHLLDELTELERSKWLQGWMSFLRKLTYKYRRPLILKSPWHLGRLKTILEIFPGAKFVHIVRNPYHVFQSFLHSSERLYQHWSFQQIPFEHIVEAWFSRHQRAYDIFFEYRQKIPRNCLCDVRFEDLERHPVAQIKEIYNTLELPPFSNVKPHLERYLKTLTNYEKNVKTELTAELKRRILKCYLRSFEEYGYEI